MDTEHEIGHLFSDSLIEVISTVTGLSLKVLAQDRDNDFEEITGLMNLSGKKNGTLFLSAKESAVRLICSRMLGIPYNDVTSDDAEDTLCELVNMNAGNVKLRLSDTDYEFFLSQPFAISGEKMTIITKDKTHVISRLVGNDEISIKMKIVY